MSCAFLTREEIVRPEEGQAQVSVHFGGTGRPLAGPGAGAPGWAGGRFGVFAPGRNGRRARRKALPQARREDRGLPRDAHGHGAGAALGIAHGIRPTRLLRELIEREGEAEAMRMMRAEFDVSAEKLALASEIVRVQAPVLQSQKKEDVDVYIGIPYCASRCLYCSFASAVRTEKTDMAAYLAALARDIAHGASIVRETGRKVRSMYLGGGTPTVLTAEELRQLLDFALCAYGGFGAELTVEAGRPDTITEEKLAVLRAAGAGRVSINPQSMNEKTLRLIGRSHTPEEIVTAFHMARDAGFASINMDVIAGLPAKRRTTCAARLLRWLPSRRIT